MGTLRGPAEASCSHRLRVEINLMTHCGELSELPQQAA
jgi:hypothetical protein